MKLQDSLPDSVMVHGRRYAVDLDFRNVLRLMETMGRDDLLASARDWQALRCVMRHPPRNWALRAELLDAIRALLFPERGKSEGPRLTSFEQDADLIRAAFRQHYGVDLFRDKLHWIEFSSLLGALPEGSKYAEVLGIRARPMPAPTKYNQEERRWLAKAKAQVALRLTEKEQAKSLNDGLRQVAESLLYLANIGGDNDG